MRGKNRGTICIVSHTFKMAAHGKCNHRLIWSLSISLEVSAHVRTNRWDAFSDGPDPRKIGKRIYWMFEGHSKRPSLLHGN